MISEFRAWDKKNKRWMTPEIEDNEESELRLDIWGSLYFKKPWFEQDSGTVIIVAGESMFDLSQSTGLQDKNGDDIFEGDIVEYFHTPAIIEKVKGGFAVVNTRDYEYITDLNGHMRILGNIYENPELMEVVD